MMMRPELHALLEGSSFAETLFDRIPDVVFFIKDRDGRYVVVNQTLVTRCGRRDKNELLGQTARQVFPSPLGNRFFEQDRRVLASGIPIVQNLELHLYPTRLEGWCLTDKLPLFGGDGRVTGHRRHFARSPITGRRGRSPRRGGRRPRPHSLQLRIGDTG